LTLDALSPDRDAREEPVEWADEVQRALVRDDQPVDGEHDVAVGRRAGQRERARHQHEVLTGTDTELGEGAKGRTRDPESGRLEGHGIEREMRHAATVRCRPVTTRSPACHQRLRSPDAQLRHQRPVLGRQRRS
jgi:hypothetical protein